VGLKPEAVVRLGIAHVSESRRVFPGLMVRKNILLGGSNRRGVPRRQLECEADSMFDLFPDLMPLERALGWTLSGRKLQMAAVARGMMTEPRMPLLDEPRLGLELLIVQQVFRIITSIRKLGTTLLPLEQNAHLASSVAGFTACWWQAC
jgi:branched-chain amino acid transport system ATP-binding protein